MIKTIKAGTHRARPITLAFFWDKREFRKEVIFHSNCTYVSEKDGDINKLFGFGYLNGGHHRDSARFGWRSNGLLIELFAYCYVSGKRQFQSLGNFQREMRYELKIKRSRSGTYEFHVNGNLTGFVLSRHKKKLQYALGPYFGGNDTAPHEMQITLE